jgi:ubiquinone/menaquinone biosynthesis C-methylase UbiE
MELEDRAAIDFVLALRRRWADTLYPRLRAEFETDGNVARANAPEAFAARVHALPSYGWFAWMERGSQKMLWRAAGDAAESTPAVSTWTGPATLDIAAEMQLPDWYTDWDIHVQPGGVWSSDRAARVYELGAKLVMLGDNDDYKFHRSFVETGIPVRPYRRIVDLGCGFGKSTWPLKKAFPEAEVIGIDLAAPCLRLAVDRSNAQKLAIGFKQADAAATGLAGGGADLVTSTMLIHELPIDVLGEVLKESARLLAPGGLLRFLDFQPTGDAFRDLAMHEHGARNNEPFLPPMMDADIIAMTEAAGLINPRWVAFDERGAGRLPTARWPERREWHFPWAVLEAEKPA